MGINKSSRELKRRALIDDMRRRGADSKFIALEWKTAFCQQYQSTKEKHVANNVDGSNRYIHTGLGFGPIAEVSRNFECLSRSFPHHIRNLGLKQPAGFHGRRDHLPISTTNLLKTTRSSTCRRNKRPLPVPTACENSHARNAVYRTFPHIKPPHWLGCQGMRR